MIRLTAVRTSIFQMRLTDSMSRQLLFTVSMLLCALPSLAQNGSPQPADCHSSRLPGAACGASVVGGGESALARTLSPTAPARAKSASGKPLQARVQANACDLNQDGQVDVLDLQLVVNMRNNIIPCSANIDGSGISCDDSAVAGILSAALGGSCGSAGTNPTVTLSWTASVSANVTSYNVYRAQVSGGPYVKINSAGIASTAFSDASVQSGQTYYYVATAVDSGNNESGYSNESQVSLP